MIYLVINLTSSGLGYEVIGTFRSQARAIKIRDALSTANQARADYTASEDDNSYHALEVEALDKYTDESIIEAYRIKE